MTRTQLERIAELAKHARDYLAIMDACGHDPSLVSTREGAEAKYEGAVAELKAYISEICK